MVTYTLTSYYKEITMAKPITKFDIKTIKSDTDNDKALSVSKAGNLNLDAKIANPSYDEDAKKGTPEYYKMTSIRECFDFFLIKPNGSVAFRLKDHVTLSGGTAVTAFAREWTPEND